MSSNRGKILIVDDEDVIRELLVSKFSKLGYETVSAVNGEDALAKLNTEEVQVVITDMKMPKLGGLDVLKAVKEKSPKSEVIIITGHATVEDALNAMKGGAYDFIQKPFNIDELTALVEKAIEKINLELC
jgi:DNA-binding NtrC family response regulator